VLVEPVVFFAVNPLRHCLPAELLSYFVLENENVFASVL
jgi:hypothetical protein